MAATLFISKIVNLHTSMSSYRYFIKIAFEGGNFCGWQIQPNALTVQKVLQETLALFCHLEGETTGCGRTDTGVHANEFYVHFNCLEPISNLDNFIYKLNRVLPKSIVVNAVYKVGNNAHCRFDATNRTYNYYILRKKNPFINNAWLNSYPLNITLMQQACNVLFEYHDFSAFSKSNTQVFTNNCKIIKAHWQDNDEMLIFTICANRFLRNMVRAIVGSMIDIGKGKYDLQGFRKIIEDKNRSNAGISVPAKGLFLTSVNYPENYFTEQAQLFGID